MPVLEVLTVAGILFNSTMLTAIYFKLGNHDEKHKQHERRLEAIENVIHIDRRKKNA